jgi:hypothetical protein
MGGRAVRFGHSAPSSVAELATTIVGMTTPNRLHDCASELVKAARAFHASADQPGSPAAAPGALASLEEALQVLSAARYQLATNASPGIVDRRGGRGSEVRQWPQIDGPSREHEVRLMGTFHDVAAAFARCARACRQGRSTIMPVTARGAVGDDRRQSDEFPRFQRYERPSERVA